MCGIAAAYAYDDRGVALDSDCLRSASEWMRCRGPDGGGSWLSADCRVSLAHRRLAIIDPSDAGAQPMCTEGEALVISFNGEIYNYRELRVLLQGRGYHFRTRTDTEVLLHLYAEKGEAMVHDLRGMFAFAIWDERRKGLFLARDHFGVKPLYYANDGRSIRVASEVKALLAGGSVDTEPDPFAQAAFYVWGHIPEPRTMYCGIRTLPAGSTMWVDRDGARAVRTYASVVDLLARAAAEPERVSEQERAERLRAAMLDSVRHHLVADVDVGVFLSAGVDSTVLASLAAEVGGRLRTVTLGFAEYRGTRQDETPVAEAVAKQLGTDHETIWVTRDDFAAELNHLIDRMDQPSIDGVNGYFVAMAAKAAGLKVAISGLGGDELFAGYSDYREIPRTVRMVSKMPGMDRMGPVLRRIVSPFVSRITSPKYSSLFEYGGDFPGAYLLRRAVYMPWELRPKLGVRSETSEHEIAVMRDVVRESLTDCPPTVIVAALESAWYMRNQLLRDTDWASMTHSVEVRVPLVDWTLWRTVAPLGVIEPGVGKRALAGTTTQRLSGEILTRPKTGFTVPMRTWMLQSGSARHAERGLRSWARYVYGKATHGTSAGISDGCVRGPGRDRTVQSRSAHHFVGQ